MEANQSSAGPDSLARESVIERPDGSVLTVVSDSLGTAIWPEGAVAPLACYGPGCHDQAVSDALAEGGRIVRVYLRLPEITRAVEQAHRRVACVARKRKRDRDPDAPRRPRGRPRKHPIVPAPQPTPAPAPAE